MSYNHLQWSCTLFTVKHLWIYLIHHGWLMIRLVLILSLIYSWLILDSLRKSSAASKVHPVLGMIIKHDWESQIDQLNQPVFCGCSNTMNKNAVTKWTPRRKPKETELEMMGCHGLFILCSLDMIWGTCGHPIMPSNGRVMYTAFFTKPQGPNAHLHMRFLSKAFKEKTTSWLCSRFKSSLCLCPQEPLF